MSARPLVPWSMVLALSWGVGGTAWAAPENVPAEGAAVEQAVPASTPATPSTVQTYAMRQTFTSQMRNPNPMSNGDWKSTRTNTYAIVQWTEQGGDVTYTEKTCAVTTDPVFGAETIYTDAFVNAIALRNRTAKLLGEGDTRRFVAGPYHQSFGVQLADPMRDPLPTDPKDPSIRDSDKDGNPGTTVVIRHPMMGEGHVFVAQRSVARLEGRRLPTGQIRGVIFTAPDMFKIHATKWWLRKETPQRQHPSPKESPFVMVPAEGTLDCAALLAHKDTLFPTHEELGATPDI